MKIIVAIALLVCLAQVAVSQAYVFRVLASKGNITYRTASEAEWKSIKTGTNLNSDDVLRILEEAYLGLVHASGRTQELANPGTFKIDDLASKMGSQKSGLASRYSEFVFNRMKAAKATNTLTATGAATRAVADSEITVLSPPSSEIYTTQPVLYWVGAESGGYTVQIKNMFDENLFEGPATGNSYQIDLNSEELKDQTIFFVVVASQDDPKAKSDAIGLERLPENRVAEIQQEMHELGEEIQTESSLGHLILAGYFDDNNLLIDALNHYKKVIQLTPGVADFELIYQDFLIRHDLD